MKRPFLLLLTLATATGLAAAERKLTIDDVVGTSRIGAVQISPDGAAVAFTLDQPNPKERSTDPPITTLWTVPTTGGATVRLANRLTAVSAPLWFPDSQWLGFLSAGKLYRTRRSGGAPEPIVPLRTGIASWQPSPDGRHAVIITVEAKPLPSAAGEDGIVMHPSEPVERRPRKQAWLVNLQTRAVQAVDAGGAHVMAARWAPDSKRLLLTVAERPYTDWEQLRPKLMVARTGQPGASLYCPTLGKITGADWSPDGQSIAFMGSVESGTDFFPSGLFVCRGEGSRPTNVTEGAGYSVESFRWSPDASAGLLVSAAEGTQRYLARLRPTEALARLTNDDYQVHFRSDWSLSRDGAILAVIRSRSTTPPDVWVLRAGAPPRRVTSVDPGLHAFKYAPSRSMTWRGPDRLEISGVLVLPLDKPSGSSHPLVVLLHGSNGGEATDFQMEQQFLASAGYAVLAVNYRGSVINGSSFMRKFRADLGGRDVDDIIAGVDEMIRIGVADPKRIGVIGGSYGGYLTACTIARSTRFKAAILRSGISNYWSLHTGQTAAPESAGVLEWNVSPYDIPDLIRERSPSTHLKKIKTPTLIFWGEQDASISVTQALELFRGLRHFGVASELIVYPREGHGIREVNHRRDMYRRLVEWFDRYLKN